MLEGSLEVQRADDSVPPSPNDAEGILRFVARECTRRCFWLIQTMEWISNIYTHRGVKPRLVELADVVRLPIDEAIFELTSLTSSASTYFAPTLSPTPRSLFVPVSVSVRPVSAAAAVAPSAASYPRQVNC